MEEIIVTWWRKQQRVVAAGRGALFYQVLLILPSDRNQHELRGPNWKKPSKQPLLRDNACACL